MHIAIKERVGRLTFSVVLTFSLHKSNPQGQLAMSLMDGIWSFSPTSSSTVIAHAGDGNFHTVILFDPSKEDQRKEAERLNHLMVHTALSMEGRAITFDALLNPFA